MKKRVPDKFWFPWWPDKWIFGSVRIEFTVAERGIWVDMLSLASKDDGHIRANEETPYPLAQLTGMLIIPEKELDAAINKFIKHKKLSKLKSGTLYVTKWEKYQFSERHKRRLEGEMSDETDTMSDDKDAIVDKSILNNNTLNNNKEEEPKSNITDKQSIEIVKELITVKGISLHKAGLLVCYMKELSLEFPDIDYVEEIKKKCSWWRDHPLSKKSNIHLQIRNWFELAVKFRKESGKDKRVGESSHAPSKKEDDYDKARAAKMKELQKKYQPEIDKAMKAHASDWLDEIDNKIKEEIAEFSRKYHKKEE